MRSLFFLLPLPLLAFPFACSSPSESSASSEQSDTAEDLATAKDVLNLLGGPDGTCVACHTATPADVKRWGTAMQAVDQACIASADLTPAARVDCLRNDPTDPSSAFSPQKLGLYAAGAPDGEFDQLFADAFADQSDAPLAAFKRDVGMPRSADLLPVADWTKVKTWVLRGMPQLDAAIANGADADADASDASTDTSDGGAAACTNRSTPELTAHIARMKTEGWGARLADLSTPMFGCGGALDALSCLADRPDVTGSIGNGAVTQTVRQLRPLGIRTNYWIRSSADGRYVGVGATPSRIFDLQAGDTSTGITVAAAYDPFFLRSNDGFAFAGVGAAGGGIALCRQSLLADVEGQSNPSIKMTEAKCAKVGTSVYESIGSALDGVSYFMTTGPHRNDNGGNQVTHPLPAGYGAPSPTFFTPMVNDGTTYVAQTAISVDLPGEGDVMLSPSGLLAATRFSAPTDTKQAGYRIHLVNATPNGTSYDVATPIGAEVCLKGGKPEISFDERFLAAHQYVDQTEPDQASLPDGSSNIVLADLATGQTYRITTMAAGQYALYPHFRADGWLYFLVRDMNTGVETVMASDAAVRLAR